MPTTACADAGEARRASWWAGHAQSAPVPGSFQGGQGWAPFHFAVGSSGRSAGSGDGIGRLHRWGAPAAWDSASWEGCGPSAWPPTTGGPSCSSAPGSVSWPFPGTALTPSSPSQPFQVGRRLAGLPVGPGWGAAAEPCPSHWRGPVPRGSAGSSRARRKVVRAGWAGWGVVGRQTWRKRSPLLPPPCEIVGQR